MRWNDDGLVLGARPHGEAGVVLEAFTRLHGRRLGLVRGGRSRRQAATLQPGNGVSLTWNARLEEHLGQFVVEATVARAATLMASRAGLAGITHLASLARLLPEREPNEGYFEVLTVIVEALPDLAVAAPLMVRLELETLAELGFGLDLSACAATGQRDDLAFVSPRSGAAVSREAGAPYVDKLFQLPAFLRGGAVAPGDVAAGFRLTGFFLERHVYGPRGLAAGDARAEILRLIGV